MLKSSNKSEKYRLFWLAMVFVLIPLALIYVACDSQATGVEEPEDWPLAYMRETGTGVFYGQTDKGIFIMAADDVHLYKLVDLKLFGGFRPGLTIEQARSEFGPPVRTHTLQNKSIAVYYITTSRIEVEDQLIAFSGEYFHRRTVYAYPKSKIGICAAKTDDVFDASVNRLIPDKGRIEVCVAEAPPEGQRVWALVDNKCVQAINWWTPASQP